MPNAGSASGDEDLGSLGPEIEFSDAGGAWYSARLLLRGDTLIVSYLDFSYSDDERFDAGSFSTAQEIADFRRRFRAVSPQMQDSQCPVVRPGMLVCASSVYVGDSVLFFDAVVDSVKRDQHTSNAEGDECLCTFILCWINGPKVGTLSLAKIDSICLIQPSDVVDPRLHSFIRVCEEKFRLCPISSAVALQNSTCKYEPHEEDYDLGGRHSLKASKYQMDANQSAGFNFIFVDYVQKDLIPSTECKIDYKRKKNGDLGEGRVLKTGTYQVDAKRCADYNCFLIDNMEKDLAPSTIVNFIRQHTSIRVKAYIFPSLPSELFTRGAIVVDSAENFQKLHDFMVNNSDQMIISSNGRPWIVAYESQYKSSSVWLMGSNIEVMEGNPSSRLKIIRSGCQEYDTALQWRNLILEFKNHLRRLHARLFVEEKTYSALAGCSLDWL